MRRLAKARATLHVPFVDTPNIDTPEVFAAEPGWTLLPPLSLEGSLRNFVVGDPNGLRLRIARFVRDVDQALMGRAWFGPEAEGPPGHAHGGSMAALLDDAMGVSCWLAGHRVLAAKIEVEFKRPLPLLLTTTFSAGVERKEGRRTYAWGRLCLPDGTVCAQSTGLFIELDHARMHTLLGGTKGPLE
jgi:acyl-coenzyme A thioesterase PaaI-like protein